MFDLAVTFVASSHKRKCLKFLEINESDGTGSLPDSEAN